MSYVDQPDRPQRSFSERWQDVWHHPTPFGLIAYIKALTEAASSIPRLMDGASISAGPPPSTEEEAYRYNQARSYVPGAAFEAARAFTPTAPKVVGGITIRPLGRAVPQGRSGSPNVLAPAERSDASRPFPRSPPPGVPPRVEYGPSQLEYAGTPPAVLRIGAEEQQMAAPIARSLPDSATSPETLPQVRAPSIVPSLKDPRFEAASGELGSLAQPALSRPTLYQDIHRQFGASMPQTQRSPLPSGVGSSGGILGLLLRAAPSESLPEPIEDSPKPPVAQPLRAGGSQPSWIGPPVLAEEEKRQSPEDDYGQHPLEPFDPNFRRLTRVPYRTQGSEGDDIVAWSPGQPVAESSPPGRPGTPISDDHLDIPEFLRRQAMPEPVNSEGKKWTDMPPAGFRGGGNYSGNGGSGGGGGGGDGWDEECKKERAWARGICIDAYANGLIGDVIKRWNSNYATGPFKKEFGKWTIDDCRRGLTRQICGGNRYDKPPQPKVKRYNLRPRRPRKKRPF